MPSVQKLGGGVSTRPVTCHPFNKASVDVILYSSDGVAFRMHYALFNESSGFFKANLRPSASNARSKQVVQVEVPEHSAVLNVILCFCYPMESPVLSTLALTEAALEAALKYNMQDATSFLKHQMLHFACNSPLRVFATACRHGLEDVASATALALSKKAREPSVGDFADELHDLTAGQYMRLLQFCQNPETAPESFCRVKTTQPRNGEDEYEKDSLVSPYTLKAAATDAILCSSDHVGFFVHSAVVATLSPVLDRMLSKAGDSVVMVEGPSLDSMEPDFGGPQLRNDGQSDNLNARPVKIDRFNFADLYSAAKKYGIASVLDLLEAVLRQHALEEPFATYFVARRFHLQDIAAEAARRTLGLPVDNMSCVEMDDVSARAYIQLVKYHEACTTAAVNLTKDYDWLKSQGFDLTPGQCLVPTSKPHSLNVAIVPTWTRILMANLRPLLRKHPSGGVVMDGRAFAKTVTELHCHSLVCGPCTHLDVAHAVFKACQVIARGVDDAVSQNWSVNIQMPETVKKTSSGGGSGPASVINHPFTKDSADAVLISFDKIKFRVHRVILSEASHFFDGLFSLPQESKSDDASTQTSHEEAPIIQVSEHSSVLDPLLRYCYPMADPVLTSLDVTIATLEAALKYELTEATELLKAQLSTHAKAAPHRVYSIACRHKMEDLALVAAEEVHRQKKAAVFHPDMNSITAGEYAKLLQFCQEGSLPTRQTFISSSTTARIQSEYGKGGEDSAVSLLPSETETADVIIVCLDGVELRAHRVILELASPVLKRMLSDAPTTSQSTTDNPANLSDIMGGTTTAANLTESHLASGVATNPRINLAQPSRIVSFLLRFCYPSPGPAPMTPLDIVDVYSAARKYDMEKVLKTFETRIKASENLEKDPLLVYFLACRCGYKSIACTAARRTLGTEVNYDYRPEMELVAARALYNLKKYRARCMNAVTTLMQSDDWLFNKKDKAVSRCAYFARLTRPCWLEPLVMLIIPSLHKDLTGATVKHCFPELLEIVSSAKTICDRCKGWDVAAVFYRTCDTLANAVDEAISRVQLPWEQY
ncbi:predicted protein [Postia placenta Mad-698-R]|nr:predicted protein [Postia placenta Mad-698-R]